jgi:hypothetical protein
MAARAESEDKPGCWVEDDGEGDGACGNGGDQFERGAVEDANKASGAVRNIGGVAILAGVVQGKVAEIHHARYLLQNFAGVDIEDRDMVGARDERLAIQHLKLHKMHVERMNVTGDVDEGPNLCCQLWDLR